MMTIKLTMPELAAIEEALQRFVRATIPEDKEEYIEAQKTARGLLDKIRKY